MRVLAAGGEGQGEARVASLSAARAAGADYLLDGTVARLAGSLRITVQLVRIATGQHVWATRFSTAGSDPFALQNDVAKHVYQAVAGCRAN
jgi:TolB-like protein